MKKLLALFFLISIIATGCSNPQNYLITYIDVKSAAENIEKWVGKSSETNGIYLGKAHTSEEGDMYYVYVNYTNLVTNKYFSIDKVSIEPGSNNSMIINVEPRPSDEKSEKLFSIKVKGKSLGKIVLNGEDIKTSSIPAIE